MPLAPLRVVHADGAGTAAVPPASPLARWGTAAAGADDACLVLDRAGRVLSLSASAALLLGCPPGQAVGRPLLDVVSFVDFDSGELAPAYAPRVPPLLALSAASLARGIVRVATDGGRRTLDVVSAPLRASDGGLAGSLSFFTAVTAR